MLANELIDRLERRGLLDQEIIEALREQLSQSGARVTPEAVAKLLVDNGQLTRFQAAKLIGELRNEDEEPLPQATLVDDDLLAVIVDDDAPEALPASLTGAETPPGTFRNESGSEPVTPSFGSQPTGDGLPRPPRKSGSIRRVEQKTVWDSFKIYGYAGIIVFLGLALYGLIWILGKGSADETIAAADKLYETRSYQPAQDAYLAFLNSFGEDNQYSSLARTRIAMAEIYRSEQMSDATAALTMAQQRLPQLIAEKGMNEERGNLSALLVDIAKNIAEAAKNATDTAEKQRLLGKLQEQQALIDNPNYMLSSMKVTLAAELAAIVEARNRVQRDIDRNIRLDATVSAMESALAAKDTKKAYDSRQALLRDFPELQDQERLNQLIRQASGIQQTLVSSSDKVPTTSDQSADTDSLKTIVLTTRQGQVATQAADEIFYLRAGGSVLALAADDGRLLWRKFTGFGRDHTPLRMDDGQAVLLSDLDSNEVRRIRGVDGQLAWRVSIDEPFAEPVSGRAAIYVSAASGRLVSLDSGSGVANWTVQFPQPIQVGAGLDAASELLYMPGDHSNLYVLDSASGKCVESFYIGHAEGTIAVPPVALLGHVFVIENAGADYAKVHILKVDPDTQKLSVAQPPFRVSGNVIVPPILLDRRVIVLTDLAQVAMYDVEVTAQQNQVSLIAEQVASYDKPTVTQMAVGRGQMWITGRRIGRYELQVNTGRIVPDWGKNDGDSFIGTPLALDDILVHARVLRGTSAIRVTGANPKTGDEIWRTDVGTPIAMLTPSPAGGFHAITSQGALFQIDAASLASGSTQGPIENPGAQGITMRFADPIAVDATRRILINQEQKTETLVYDNARRTEKLRKVTLLLGQGNVSGGQVCSGGGLFMAMDSGRAVLADWQTGQMLGSPFQPASDPTAKVAWTNAVHVSDDADQVIIADDRKSIYRLRVGDQIRELASNRIESPFITPLVAVGDAVVGGTNGPAADYLVGHNQSDLKPRFQTQLDGRVIWGPVPAEGREALALLMTDDGTLRGFQADGTQALQIKPPHPGLPVSGVVMMGSNWLLAGRDGWLISIDPQTGNVLASKNLGQPISAPPLAVGKNLLVPGVEGVIYVTELSDES